MLDYLTEHKKQITIVGIVVFFVIIVMSLVFIIKDIGKTANVNIIVAPSIAEVRIGDNKYSSYGNFKIYPGEYTVEVSAEGFKTKTGEIVVNDNETVEIGVYLEPEEGNENYYADNPADATILGDLKAAETMKRINKLKEDNPILYSLPLEIDYYTNNYAERIKYTITYTINEDNTNFAIEILDYTGDNYDDALSKLRARGMEVDEYEIKYQDLTSEMEWGRAE